MPSKRFLTTWDADWEPDWAARVDAVHAYDVGRRRTLRTLLAQAGRHDVTILRGSVGKRELYVDLLAAAVLGRRGHRVLLVDTTWEPGSRVLDRLLRTPRPLGVDAVSSRGGGLVRRAIALLDGPTVHYGVLSRAEEATFAATWGVDPARVHFVPFCATLERETAAAPEGRSPLVFAGGDSMRDFRALLAAAPAIDAPLTVATRLPVPAAEDPRHRFGPLDPAAFDEAAAAATISVTPLIADAPRSAGQKTYLNAMLLGQAAVVTEAPGVRDHVRDGVDALVVPNEPEALAAAINGLLADPERAEAMGRAGRERVQASLTGRDFYRAMRERAEAIADAASPRRNRVRGPMGSVRDRAAGAVKRVRQRVAERQDLDELVARGLQLGERVSLERRCYIDASFAWAITIEDDVRISSDVTILAHSAVAKTEAGFAEVRPVRLRKLCQVGIGATILPGSDIGERTMIAAGALVTGPIPADSIAGGVPAKVIGSFDDYLARFKGSMEGAPVLDGPPDPFDAEAQARARAMLLEHGRLYLP